VIALVVVLIVVGVVVFRTTSPDERARFLELAVVFLRQVRSLIAESNRQLTPYYDVLRERTRWPVATFALAGVSVAVFAGAVLTAGPLANQETLLAWGASLGPRTTHGEWWRIVTATFVHGGFLSLVLHVAALVQIGTILERIVGHWTVAAVYVAAGILGTVVNLSVRPIEISLGAAQSVAAIYGLFVATMGWMVLRKSAMTPPLAVLKRLAPVAAIFFLSNLGDWFNLSPELVGVVVGVVSGGVLARGVSEGTPRVREVAIAAAVTAVIAVVAGMSLRGITDARPEIAQVVELEDRTAAAYEDAVGRFRKGRISAQALVDMIERRIVPELQAGRARVEALEGIPTEHQPLVTGAGEYFRLRDESWRLRAEGLKKTNMRALQEAERVTAASLDALRRVAEAVETL
jgi:membrane associated rhomboid family serine protease